MTIKAFNIDYETDGEKISLPSELIFEVDDDFDAENDLADLISDETGWLVLGCSYKVVKKLKGGKYEKKNTKKRIR